MTIKLCWLGALLLCSGCIVTDETTPSSSSTMPGGLSGFTGCYENQSTPLKPGPNHYLSRIIWPDRSLTHTAIEAIKVSAPDDQTLQVAAYAKKHAVLNQTLTVS